MIALSDGQMDCATGPSRSNLWAHGIELRQPPIFVGPPFVPGDGPPMIHCTKSFNIFTVSGARGVVTVIHSQTSVEYV